MTPLLLSCSQFTDGTMITVTGELDSTNAQLLEAYRAEVHPDLTRPLVLDLGGMTFMDSSGLQLLLRLHDLTRRSGGPLLLADLHPRAARVLEITGVLPRLTVYATPEEALHAAGLVNSTAP